MAQVHAHPPVRSKPHAQCEKVCARGTRRLVLITTMQTKPLWVCSEFNCDEADRSANAFEGSRSPWDKANGESRPEKKVDFIFYIDT